MEKLLVRTISSRVRSFVNLDVAFAWLVRSWKLATLLNDITKYNYWQWGKRAGRERGLDEIGLDGMGVIMV